MIPIGLNLWAMPSHGPRDLQSLTLDFGAIAALGYSHLEVTCGPMDRLRFGDDLARVDALLDAARAHGLSITSLCSGATWDAPLNAPDSETRRVARDSVEQLIRMAGRIGQGTVVLLTPGTTTMPGRSYSGMTSPESWDLAQQALAPLLPFAAEYGVRLGLENSWTRFLNSPLEAQRFLDQMNSPSLGWYLDLGNGALFADPCDWIQTLGHRIFMVQAKDFIPTAEGGRLVVPGEGRLDYTAIAQALDKARYAGPLIVEAPPDGKSAACAAHYLKSIPGLATCNSGLESLPGPKGKQRQSSAKPIAGTDAVLSAQHPQRQYRVALVGLGNMGRHHASYLLSHPKVQLSDVVDPTGKFVLGPRPTMKGIRRCRRLLGLTLDRFPATNVRRHRDLASLLREPDPTDLIWLCTPTDQHAHQIRMIQERGIDVFCEKPLARNVAEAKELIAPEEPRLFCGHVLRFWPEWVYLQERILDGRFGALHSLDLWRFSGRPQHSEGGWLHDEDRSGGALLDLHVHEADFILGLPWTVDGVTASVGSDADESPQEIQASYRFAQPDAPRVQCRSGWLLPKGFPFLAGFRARFEGATLCMNDGAAHPGLRLYPESGGHEVIKVKGDAFRDQLNAVLQSMNGIGASSDPRLEVSRGVAAIALIEATRRSADQASIEPFLVISSAAR
jgi:sugar phosphate isomerase/epimerase/predicted dehydrogenase